MARKQLVNRRRCSPCPISPLADGDSVGSKYCAPCKGVDIQWVQVPPGDGSFQPEAVGAAEEVTNPSKPLT